MRPVEPAPVPHSRLPWVLPALGFGVAIYLTLPAVVVALNDDFGYLRSVVATLQHGRPWTDDWLEPWAASFSVLAAALYRMTHNFHLATYGLLAALAAVNFAALAALWTSRGFSRPGAALLTLGLLTFPTVFWKEMEFTGMALHLSCLLLALWLAERRRWRSFLLVWLIAIANRQSALAWAAIPGIECLRSLAGAPARRSRAWRETAVIAGAGGIFFLVLARMMNPTLARRLITAPSLAHFTWRNAGHVLLLGGVVFFLAAGVANLFAFLRPMPEGGTRRGSYLLQLGAALAGLELLALNWRGAILCDHPGFFGAYGLLYARIVFWLALLGWLRPGATLDPRKLAYALAALGPLVFREGLWDYYFVDVAVFGLLSLRPIPAAPPAPVRPRWFPLAGGTVLVVVLVFQFRLIYEVKLLFIDHGAALCQVTERALRQGKLEILEIGHTNIGFMGWYLQPHYATHEGATDASLVGFVRYLRGNTVSLTLSPLALSPDAPGLRLPGGAGRPDLLATGIYHRGWIFFQRYTLTRGPPAASPPGLALDRAAYRPVPFPLDNAEWSDLIARRGRWAPSAPADTP